ncbi:bifunctional riboflavin kinase/FAD synthetase [Corynebacterium uterequi]|uniref:Riboflavin biosynthesis protein n=1 Tax=Corynebacterium uterequi TaxID=1072256 RepID=A0A0G3HHB8_9CORY|nr:bifunctional riboflavin kinase/FAD synthetase [Corynebacterium uterequi]AKK11323.1 riboflavin kinase/FMN adenylyltransferase [Corynebacterium uterequi]
MWHGLDEVNVSDAGTVVTIGVFDGVHRGHQRLINSAVSAAAVAKLPSVMVTFDPHPREVFCTDMTATQLTTVEVRTKLCEELGIDAVLSIDFRRELAGLSPKDYVDTLLVDTLHARHVVVGQNFTFGDMGRGTAHTMQELCEERGIEVTVVELLHDGEERLCSTMIRDALAEGDVARASWALGRPYCLTGEVVHGAGRGGRELGFPTANQYFSEQTAMPADGVYAGWFVVHGPEPIDGNMHPNRAYPAAISVGTNPTFGDRRRSVESFVLDRHADLYGRAATVYFVQKIRDMVRFESVEELLRQINADVDQIRHILIDAPRPKPLGA